jgi:hypothetical protein
VTKPPGNVKKKCDMIWGGGVCLSGRWQGFEPLVRGGSEAFTILHQERAETMLLKAKDFIRCHEAFLDLVFSCSKHT